MRKERREMRKLDACMSKTYDEFIQIFASWNSSSFPKRVLGIVLGLIGSRRFKRNYGFSISFQFYRSGKRLAMDFQCVQIQLDLKKCAKNRFHHTSIPINSHSHRIAGLESTTGTKCPLCLPFISSLYNKWLEISGEVDITQELMVWRFKNLTTQILISGIYGFIQA